MNHVRSVSGSRVFQARGVRMKDDDLFAASFVNLWFCFFVGESYGGGFTSCMPRLGFCLFHGFAVTVCFVL